MVEEFKASLRDLTGNSKPMIRFLTCLAEDYIEEAPAIVNAIEERISMVSTREKLPFLYLIDSVIKSTENSTYSHLFGQNIINTFKSVFSPAQEKLKQDLFKLRNTWIDVFPESVLFNLDRELNSVDSDWPVMHNLPPDEVQKEDQKTVSITEFRKIEEELASVNKLVVRLQGELDRKSREFRDLKEHGESFSVEGSKNYNDPRLVKKKRRFLLPTPGILPEGVKTDPRYAQLLREGGQKNEEVVINDVTYPLDIGTTRIVDIGAMRGVKIETDMRGRVLVDGMVVYNIGEPIKDVKIRAIPHKVFFHGDFRPLWIDRVYVDARADAPPMEFLVASGRYEIRVDSPTGNVIIDGQVVGVYGGPAVKISLRDGIHELRCREPPKMVIIDGKHHTVVFDEDVPFVFVGEQARGVSFYPGFRDLLLDDQRHTMELTRPATVEIDGVLRTVSFGGPCHELMIDKMFFEVGFDDVPRTLLLFGFRHRVAISGPVPQIKLLCEIPQFTANFKAGKYTNSPTVFSSGSPNFPNIEQPVRSEKRHNRGVGKEQLGHGLRDESSRYGRQVS